MPTNLNLILGICNKTFALIKIFENLKSLKYKLKEKCKR